MTTATETLQVPQAPNYRIRRLGAVGVTLAGFIVAGGAGNHYAHESAPNDNRSEQLMIKQPIVFNVEAAAAKHPNDFREHTVKSIYDTAGELASKYAAPGDYDNVVREIRDQEYGSVLEQKQNVYIEKDLLADPNAPGLHKVDSAEPK
jgi:hypothetical protein